MIWEFRIMNILMIAFLFHLASCASMPSGPGPKIVPYSSQPEKGGMVRTQNNEVVPYLDSKGWVCHPPKDYKELINWCVAPDPVKE